MARRRRATPAEKRELEKALERLRRGLRVRAPDRIHRILADVDQRDVRQALRTAAAEATQAVAADVAAGVAVAQRSVAAMLPPKGARYIERASSLLRTRARAGFAMGQPGGWSEALHGGTSKRLLGRIGAKIDEVVRGVRAAGQIAQDLRDVERWRVPITSDGPGSVRVPQRIRALQREARKAIRAVGDPAAKARYARALARMEAATEKLVGTARGTKAAGRTLMRDIDAAVRALDDGAVQDAVDWWAWKREQIHQRATVEFEAQRA